MSTANNTAATTETTTTAPTTEATTTATTETTAPASTEASTTEQSTTATTETTTAAPDTAAMKAYLVEKTEDGAKALEGKTDVEIASLFGALKAKEDIEANAPKAPEKYETFKVAENVKISEAVQTKLEDYARANNLPQEAAQALFDLAPEVNKMFTEQLTATAAETTAKWADETRVDKEIARGGDKKILDENLKYVAKARDAFATPELLALLNPFDPAKNKGGTGFGNHPEVVRLFLRLGKAISEDNTLVDGKESTTPQTAAQKLYSKTNKPK